MKTELTQNQINSYQENGFVYHPGFLSPAEVAELKGAVLATVTVMGKEKVAGRGAAPTEGKSYYDKVFTQRLNLWRIDGTVKRFMLNPALGAMLGRLEGTGGFRVWHDQALIKEPYGNPTRWHLDNPFWSFYSRNSISIWIALEDATPHNGCMYFIPGTHKLARFDNVGIGSELDALFKVYPEMAEIDPIPVPMKAGDCSFHNGLVAHGAGANMTRGRRIAMTCAYMPESDDYFRSLKMGGVLENDDWNPRLISR